jgi:hypothetical protein
MGHRKINILVAAIGIMNPNSIGWIHGLKKLGHNVAVAVPNRKGLSQQKLLELGFLNKDFPNIPLFCHDNVNEMQKQVLCSFGTEPDLVFFWEGIGILKKVQEIKRVFNSSKVVFCMNTYPNCASLWREIEINWKHGRINSLIDGYIFYSRQQKELFLKNVSQAKARKSITMIDPFFESAFYSPNDQSKKQVIELRRYDDAPHVIFTGNASKLWNKSRGHSGKDALGPFLESLCEHGIHVFVHEKADTKNISNLHLFPTFRNPDLIEGKFSHYISSFDAHLVVYNEHTSTGKRRVSTGLATRFSYALTATCPIAVTETSEFVKDLWKDMPFGFTFRDVGDLVSSLRDSQKLKMFRSNMEKIHKNFSFESQAEYLEEFLQGIADS